MIPITERTDVILFYPSSSGSFKDSYSPPHSLLSIASELVEEYNVLIIDQRVDYEWEKKLRKHLSGGVLCIAFSVMTGPQIKCALDTARICREEAGNSIPLVWGGVHPSMLSDETLSNQYVDIVIRGEGEITFKNLLNALRSNKPLSGVKGISYKKDGVKRHNPDVELFGLENAKPTPWHLINVERYIDEGRFMFDSGVKRVLDIGVTSRGCPHGCTFCYNMFFYKRKWRALSARRTYSLIKQCVDDFNLDAVWLHDDNYFVDLKRVDRVAELMINNCPDIQWTNSGITIHTYKQMSPETKAKIVRSGCSSFRFGIESASTRMIRLIDKPNTKEDIFQVNKDVMKYNITPIYSFMAGFPTETKSEILETCRAMVRLKRENPGSRFHSVSIYTPYPGTPLYGMAIKCGFKPPKRLEDWSNVFWGSKETSVSLAKVGRSYLDNIQDISYLTSDWLDYVLPGRLKAVIRPFKWWLNFRWQQQLFSFAPELALYRRLYHTTH